MSRAIISVDGDGTYNTFGTESYLNGQIDIRGGKLNVKVIGVSDPLVIGTATITPQIDYKDSEWAGLLNQAGDTIQEISSAGSLNIGAMKVGMRLRYKVDNYSVAFEIGTLS